MERDWIKDTVFFLTSQAISIFGSFLVQYAIMWHITLTSRSGVMMTIYIICGLLPMLLITPFAGVWADRFNRKILIILSDSFTAIVTLILALLFRNGYDMLWLLFIASGLRSLGSAVQMPAVGAILPQIVPRDKLMRVNGINNSVQSLVTLGSPMLSGVLLTFAPLEIILFIDVFTAVIAVIFLGIFLRLAPHRKTLEKLPLRYFKDLKEGIDYIRQRRYLRSFFIMLAILYFLLSPVSFLTPLQVARSFGPEVWRLTAIEVVFSAGMALGGILIATCVKSNNKIYTIALGCFVFAVCTIGLGITPRFWLYLLLMGIAGSAMTILGTPATVLIQEKVEEDFIGRVFSVMTMISGSMIPVGMLLFGPLADIIPIEWMLIATGILMCIESIVLIKDKALIEAGRQSLPAA